MELHRSTEPLGEEPTRHYVECLQCRRISEHPTAANADDWWTRHRTKEHGQPTQERTTTTARAVLSDEEWRLLEAACAAVAPPARPPAIGTDADYPDYITNLLLTVLDLQLHNVTVNNSITHYRNHRWDEIRTLDDLASLLSRFDDDAEGNRAAAQYLWGYDYGNRVGWLRGLVRWARDNELTDQARLRAWAYASDYRRDFAGKIKHLGIAAYCWLVMRLGVDTAKPDTMLHAFVTRVLDRDLDDERLVEVITEAAHRVGRAVRELDAGIWESERGGPGSI